jgi:hypothetical protein
LVDLSFASNGCPSIDPRSNSHNVFMIGSHRAERTNALDLSGECNENISSYRRGFCIKEDGAFPLTRFQLCGPVNSVLIAWVANQVQLREQRAHRS